MKTRLAFVAVLFDEYAIGFSGRQGSGLHYSISPCVVLPRPGLLIQVSTCSGFRHSSRRSLVRHESEAALLSF